MIYETQAQIDEALEYWQKVLRLQDWLILARVARENDMYLENCMGSVHMVLDRKEANIKLLDPLDYHNQSWPQDHELTLVHELLHLHFEPLRYVADVERQSGWKAAEEQAICSISSGLVNLKRQIVEEDMYGVKISWEKLTEASGLSAIDRGLTNEVTDDPAL